jgi:hypothetical protein
MLPSSLIQEPNQQLQPPIHPTPPLYPPICPPIHNPTLPPHPQYLVKLIQHPPFWAFLVIHLSRSMPELIIWNMSSLVRDNLDLHPSSITLRPKASKSASACKRRKTVHLPFYSRKQTGRPGPFLCLSLKLPKGNVRYVLQKRYCVCGGVMDSTSLSSIGIGHQNSRSGHDSWV